MKPFDSTLKTNLIASNNPSKANSMNKSGLLTDHKPFEGTSMITNCENGTQNVPDPSGALAEL